MAATRAKKTDGSKDEKWHYAGSPNPAPPAGTPANAGWISPRWKKIYASNITADPETGIGKWTEADFMRAMKTGITPDGRVLDAQMRWNYFQKITDRDLRSLWRISGRSSRSRTRRRKIFRRVKSN